MKWFRFYHDAIDDPKVQRLPGDLFKFWVNMLCLASRSSERGVVKLDPTEIAFALRVPDETAEQMIAELVRRDLLDECTDGLEIHNWSSRQFKSDDVTARVREHRNSAGNDADNVAPNAERTPDETLHETLQATPDATLKPSVNTDSRVTDTEEQIQNKNGATAPKKSPNYSAEFEQFWTAYPSGHGVKKTAYDQWKRLKPDDLTRRKIMTGLDRWKRCERWQNGFVKSAHLWLRDRWWENEPPPPQRVAVNGTHLSTPDHDEPFDFFAE